MDQALTLCTRNVPRTPRERYALRGPNHLWYKDRSACRVRLAIRPSALAFGGGRVFLAHGIAWATAGLPQSERRFRMKSVLFLLSAIVLVAGLGFASLEDAGALPAVPSAPPILDVSAECGSDAIPLETRDVVTGGQERALCLIACADDYVANANSRSELRACNREHRACRR